MAFDVYMLRCTDDSIYVGHTENLEVRLAAHQQRAYCGYTAKRLPVALIYSEAFASRDEAFTAERKIKGWSRAKKIALAQGDFKLVVCLAAVRSPERRRATSVASGSAHGTRASP